MNAVAPPRDVTCVTVEDARSCLRGIKHCRAELRGKDDVYFCAITKAEVLRLMAEHPGQFALRVYGEKRPAMAFLGAADL